MQYMKTALPSSHSASQEQSRQPISVLALSQGPVCIPLKVEFWFICAHVSVRPCGINTRGRFEIKLHHKIHLGDIMCHMEACDWKWWVIFRTEGNQATTYCNNTRLLIRDSTLQWTNKPPQGLFPLTNTVFWEGGSFMLSFIFWEFLTAKEEVQFCYFWS